MVCLHCGAGMGTDNTHFPGNFWRAFGIAECLKGGNAGFDPGIGKEKLNDV